MLTLGIDGYSIVVQEGSFPELYDTYRREASFLDELDVKGEGTPFFVGIKKGGGWPGFCVALRYTGESTGFSPAVVFVPESNILFVGAGEVVLAYDVHDKKRLWRESVDCGFWSWYRYDTTVLMASELEFAAWTITGERLWSTYVEPPWDFNVVEGIVMLDVMGDKRSFPLLNGPE